MIYDLIVLGGGPAGYHISERAAHAKLQVLCIEKNQPGGVCLNEGCIPTKTLLYSAKLYDGATHGSAYGISAEQISIDHAKVVKRKNKVVKTLVAGIKAALKNSGAALVNAEGIIAGKNEDGFCVTANGETYVGKNLLIATGSNAAVPPIPGLKEGLESGFVVTNREILDLTQPPEKLVVIGGGVIGLEMASYFNSIGTKVSVIEMLDHIAGENDASLTALLQKNYERKGISFYLNAKVTSVEEGRVNYLLNDESCSMEADCVLLSIGRRPNIQNIGLETIDVATERGCILTDEHMQTNVPGVYAAGDVNGKSMLAHTAYREADVALNHMLGKDDCMRYNTIPAVVYTNPELSSVGETEATAKAKGIAANVISIPMRFSGRYLAENDGGDGIFKLVIDPESRTILGAQALCNYSSEFIAAIATCMEAKLTLEQIEKIVFPHPTVCEILKDAIAQYKANEHAD